MHGLDEIRALNDEAMAETETAALTLKETAKTDPLEDVDFLRAALASALIALQLIENGESHQAASIAFAARMAMGKEGGMFTDEQVEAKQQAFERKWSADNDDQEETKLIVAA